MKRTSVNHIYKENNIQLKEKKGKGLLIYKSIKKFEPILKEILMTEKFNIF